MRLQSNWKIVRSLAHSGKHRGVHFCRYRLVAFGIRHLFRANTTLVGSHNPSPSSPPSYPYAMRIDFSLRDPNVVIIGVFAILFFGFLFGVHFENVYADQIASLLLLAFPAYGLFYRVGVETQENI